LAAPSNGQVSNPRRILEVFDRHLTGPAEITLFGRAALALAFPSAPAQFHNTRDVDAILPFKWLSAEDENMDFWLAQQATNEELSPEGLYVTHLFRESEVIVQPDWASRRVKLPLRFVKLAVYRPAVVDLILTKMSRADEQDLEDIQFLLHQESVPASELSKAFSRARVPDVAEIRALFLAAQSKVLRLAGGHQSMT
jgi:hypothetical protein